MRLIYKIYIVSFFCFLNEPFGFSQDPHFTQFYNSTLTVNPAYTGVFSCKDETNNPTNIRFLSNYRNQWSNTQSPYNTGTVQIDAKLGSQDEVIEANTIQNKVNLGLLCMYDQSLNGALKSSYFMGTASLHLAVGNGSGFGIGTAKSAEHTKSLGLGFGFVYGNRVIDLSKISFSQQFTSGGFDLTLPNGETGLNNMKPFFSLNAGLLYQSQDEGKDNRFKLGISGYHLNKPKQSFLKDESQIVPVRYSIQMEYMKYLSNSSRNQIFPNWFNF
jgi:type IX secretion system PorP/SprF family membrane protein